MRTNIEIDDELLAQTMTALGCRTKRDTVEAALRLALQLKRQQEIFDLVDPDTFFPGYDPEEGEEPPKDDWSTGAKFSPG